MLIFLHFPQKIPSWDEGVILRFQAMKRLSCRNIPLFPKAGLCHQKKHFQVFLPCRHRSPSPDQLAVSLKPGRILYILWRTGKRLFQAQNTMSALQQPPETKTHKKDQHILIILKQMETKEKQTISVNSWHQFSQPLLDSCPECGPERHLMQKKGCFLVKPCVIEECCSQSLFGLGFFQLTQRWSEDELRMSTDERASALKDTSLRPSEQVSLIYLLTLSVLRWSGAFVVPLGRFNILKCLSGWSNVMGLIKWTKCPSVHPPCWWSVFQASSSPAGRPPMFCCVMSPWNTTPALSGVKELVRFNLKLYLKATLFLRLTWIYCRIWYITVSASTPAQCHWSGLTGLWCGTILAFHLQLLLESKRVRLSSSTLPNLL